ncbi:MAG TPA: serine/threonine-protein kinase [Thermoanaerobaculia bacterium]|jgi:tetratricopeptide (TPR) repeat protein|nr:serine/threonine-protein kinase [Thermoanaerobaculia bacterium]
MDARRWQQIKALIDDALAAPTEEQTRIVREAAGTDRGLADEALLYLSHVTGGDSPEGVATSLEGQRVGPYRIIREIEFGGMGEVYEAEQDLPLQRRVALKLVRQGLDSARIVARFDGERQALALMNHPTISHVFDAGTNVDGRPYFAMELIDGEPITDYCDAHRADLRQRLMLFIKVCEGVQHAHQKGIVHQDLKPANVLVALRDGKPVPKIIDFGIASALDSWGRAPSGTGIGTPGYMSPEQWQGEPVDTRTDLYSLGVLLHVLLVGELPRGERGSAPLAPSVAILKLPEGAAAARAKARSTCMRALERRLRGDLDWIVAKATQSDRANRYASVSELAIDVSRHLQDEPVLAGPSTTAYRLNKFLRRHRPGMAAAAMVALALVGGVVGAGLGLMRARRAEDLAREEARRASREARTANRVRNFMVGLFETSEPDKARGNTITAREILDAGSRRINAELQDEPGMRATLMSTMGVVYKQLGLYDSAEPLLAKALAIREAKLGRDDAQSAGIVNEMAELQRLRGRYPEAEALHLKALAIRSRLLGRTHPDVADSLNELGLLRLNQGRYRQAEADLKEAARIWRGASDDMVVHALSNLAVLYRDEGKLDQAAVLFEEMIAWQEKTLGPEHSDVIANVNNVADLYRMVGRYAKAEALFQRALAVNIKVMGPEHPRVATTLSNLAMVYRLEGKYRQAEDFARRGLALDAKLQGEHSPDFATSLNNLAMILREEGRYDEAEPMFQQALVTRRKVLGYDHPLVANSLNQIGLLRTATGRYAEAERLFTESLRIREAALGPDHPYLAVTLTNLASLYQKQGRYREAEPPLTRALAIWDRLEQPNLPDLVATLELGAVVLRQLGQPAKAMTCERRAQQIRRQLREAMERDRVSNGGPASATR